MNYGNIFFGGTLLVGDYIYIYIYVCVCIVLDFGKQEKVIIVLVDEFDS